MIRFLLSVYNKQKERERFKMTIEIDDELYARIKHYQLMLKDINLEKVVDDALLVGMTLIVGSQDFEKIIATCTAATIIYHKHRAAYIKQRSDNDQQSTSA